MRHISLMIPILIVTNPLQSRQFYRVNTLQPREDFWSHRLEVKVGWRIVCELELQCQHTVRFYKFVPEPKNSVKSNDWWGRRVKRSRAASSIPNPRNRVSACLLMKDVFMPFTGITLNVLYRRNQPQAWTRDPVLWRVRNFEGVESALRYVNRNWWKWLQELNLIPAFFL